MTVATPVALIASVRAWSRERNDSLALAALVLSGLEALLLAAGIVALLSS
jgi:hypothetical protein